MKRHLLMLAIASCFAATQAAAMTQDEYKVAKEKIEADYKMDKAKCDGMKDNTKDVCQKEAEGKQKVAKAELDQQFMPSDARAMKVEQEKVDAAYAVAKEKCDDMTGDAKAACVKQARAEESKGKADLRAQMMMKK